MEPETGNWPLIFKKQTLRLLWTDLFHFLEALLFLTTHRVHIDNTRDPTKLQHERQILL